jgi:tetratricopeptide (TPR) repeat protein
VKVIQKFDYEGNRGALKMLFEDLNAYTADQDLAPAVRYWRGFAMWRRAINGFNETPTPTDLENDLLIALNEFEEALRLDPKFLDAKIGEIGTLGYLLYLHRSDPGRKSKYLDRLVPLAKQAVATDPNHPRLLWVLGPGYWIRPVEQGGGEERAFEAYRRGLAEIRERKKAETDPLMPSWGEPELLMNLAWSNMNRKQPDLAEAEQDANAALALVPDWHYVRDLLLPQIHKAQQQVRSKQERAQASGR